MSTYEKAKERKARLSLYTEQLAKGLMNHLKKKCSRDKPRKQVGYATRQTQPIHLSVKEAILTTTVQSNNSGKIWY